MSNLTKVVQTTYGKVWSAPSSVKIAQQQADNMKQGGAALTYDAVRNEYESCQLAISADKAIRRFELTACDLTNGKDIIAKEYVNVYMQKYVSFRDYSGPHTLPDALLPMEAAKAYGENMIARGCNGALWVTVYVPKHIAADTYKGTFKLYIEGDEGEVIVDIPVSVKVYDYTLADVPTAKTLFSWRYDRVGAGELDESIEMMTHYYDFFQDYRISLQAIPLETLSGEEFANTVKKYYERFTSYTILVRVGDISPCLYNREAEAREQILAIAKMCTPEKNYFEKAMIYMIDEPYLTEVDVRPWYIESFGKMKQILERIVETIKDDTTGVYDGLKAWDNWEQIIMEITNIVPITTGATDWLLEHRGDEECEAILKAMNCMCPYFVDINEDKIERLYGMYKEFNYTIWWYGCLMPKIPSATYHIGDKNLLSARTVSWLQSKYDVEGNLYWDAAAYTDEAKEYDNEYVNVYTAPYRHTASTFPGGDGFLAYPGAAYGIYGAVPSTRLMSIRDGMEEYELLEELKKVDRGLVDKFCTSIASDIRRMYNDGEEGLDFTAVRKELLGLLEKYGIKGDTSSSENRKPVVYETLSDKGVYYEDNQVDIQNAVADEELIFSFDSYEKITGARIRMGYELGATRVNKDAKYITEGNGSWMIDVQGDYGREDLLPYFQLRCTGTTFRTGDFSGYDKVMLDIYNASDKEVKIAWKLRVANKADEEFSETEEETYTLKPNAWTTCEYDLRKEVYTASFNLKKVKHMIVSFLTKKQAKEDVPVRVYLDNLRGHLK